jgi:SEC-C motif-containing protein
LRYAACCGRWHSGVLHLQADSALALMRSRYAAYVLDLRDYLVATTHPSTRPIMIEPLPEGVKWLGLEVKRHTVIDDVHAQVEFVARSKLAGRAQRLHEVSRFLREGGRWYYVDDVQVNETNGATSAGSA